MLEFEIIEFSPSKICTECAGACCKSISGPYTPDDVIRIFGSVQGAKDSGIVAIDSWSGDPEKYFMRPRLKNAKYTLYDFSFGGECIHLTDKGCSLERDKMPHFCKRLEPKEGPSCNDHCGNFRNSKDLAKELWFQSELHKELAGG